MVGEVLEAGWTLTKLYWLTAWLVLFTGAGTSIVVGIILQNGLGLSQGTASYLTTLLTIPVTVGVFMSFVRLARGESGGPASVFAHYDKFLQLCFTSVLVYLLAGIGFLLLIVPGVIVVLGLGFAPYLVVDRNLGVAEALRGSWDLMMGHKVDAFLLATVSIVGTILSMIPFGLGLLLTMPLFSFAMAVFYNRVLDRAGQHGSAAITAEG